MVIGLLAAWSGNSHAETTYTYDELNRLRIVDYGDGTKIEYIYDAAGNRITVQIPTSPTGTIKINSGAACTDNTNVMLTLSCNSSQGCSQMQFSNDNITYSTPEIYPPTTKAWTLTPVDGDKIVYVKFQNTAGHWSADYSDTSKEFSFQKSPQEIPG
jgi:YD repeat-containing protein